MKKLLYVNDLGWNIIVDGVISEYDMLTLKEKNYIDEFILSINTSVFWFTNNHFSMCNNEEFKLGNLWFELEEVDKENKTVIFNLYV